MDRQAADLWQKTLATLETKLSKPSFETWFKSTKPVSYESNTLIVSVPNDFARDWLESRYSIIIKETLNVLTMKEVAVKFVIPQVVDESLYESTPKPPVAEQTAGNNATAEDYTPTALNPKYTFDTFVIGAGNRFAHAASLAVAEAPAKSYNPLFIYGGVGLGKTHLMHAIGHYVLEHNPSAKVVYISSEKFTNEFINAIRDNKTVDFRNK